MQARRAWRDSKQALRQGFSVGVIAMNKKIMTISGGPRRDGCSEELLRRFTGKINAEFVHYDAYERNYAPCTDCRYCREQEGCSNDDMDGFFDDFEACDGIIIASPVYNLSFPSPMKAIIDRMQRYYSARFYLNKRPVIARRRPVALLLSAGSPEEDGEICARQLEQIFTVTNCELLCCVVVNGTDDADDSAFADDLESKIKFEADYFSDWASSIAKSSLNS